MTTKWFEIRVSLERDEPTQEGISSTFQKVVLPLYKLVNSLLYIKRGHYLTEPHTTQDNRTPYVWMVRWEVENWEENSTELKQKTAEFLRNLGYVDIKERFEKNKVYYTIEDNAEYDKNIFTEKYANLFFNIMSDSCKFQEGVLNHNPQKNPELTEHKLIHCILNAYGNNSAMELTFYVIAALYKFPQMKGYNSFNKKEKEEFMVMLDNYLNGILNNKSS